jgi:hydroxymethylpyrimidine/phosphomethylpyrimidine kinase
MNMKKVLTIAGSDSSGGAGIQADLKAFSAHGVFGMSVITAVTAQNTQGVFAVQDMTPEMIASQLDAIFSDIEVDAVKIGMVSQIETIKIIADKLKQYAPKNVVVDPVMISKSGYDLLSPDAKETLIQELIPLATVITPNLPEAEVITGKKIETIEEMKEAAIDIYSKGAKAVLVKGGHLEDDATDISYDGQTFTYFHGKRIESNNTHGTGCTLSSAIASNLANELSLTESIQEAKDYITTAIKHSFPIGKGVGPVHHFYTLYENAGMNKVKK